MSPVKIIHNFIIKLLYWVSVCKQITTMAINTLQTLEVIEVMENFIDRNRASDDIRQQDDLSYKIEDQSIIIYEVMPHWDNPEEIIEIDIAKATYVKTRDLWRVFYIKSDARWHIYYPHAVVKTLREFATLVEMDDHGYFWG